MLRFAGGVFQKNFRQRVHGGIGRWTRWEFWPPWLFYLPVGVYYTWLAIRYRGFTVPTAANPGIFSGGFVGESKIATLAELGAKSPAFTAEAHLIEGATPAERFASVERLRPQHRIELP